MTEINKIKRRNDFMINDGLDGYETAFKHPIKL